MIRIENRAPRPEKIVLGEIVEFGILRDDPAIETRCFLKQQRIFYLKPLGPWDTATKFFMHAEAPGVHTLVVQWRLPGGEGGWESTDFEVVAWRRRSDRPYRIRLDRATQIWAPSRYEAMALKESENPVLSLLPELVSPGAVVYDIGANLGMYAIPLARLIGDDGFIYCIEASPLCVPFLRMNLTTNQLHNFEIIPAALLDRSKQVGFVLNYGNSSLGTTAATDFYSFKAGHTIDVECFTLDHLIEAFSLRPPDFIKIDVEGVEDLVIQGMMSSLAKWRPRLLIELHGRGAAERTMELLDRAEYRYRTPDGRVEFADGEEVWLHFGDAVFQLVAEPLRQ